MLLWKKFQSLCDDSGIDLFWNMYKVHHEGSKEEHKVQESRERSGLHDYSPLDFTSVLPCGGWSQEEAKSGEMSTC